MEPRLASETRHGRLPMYAQSLVECRNCRCHWWCVQGLGSSFHGSWLSLQAAMEQMWLRHAAGCQRELQRHKHVGAPLWKHKEQHRCL